MDLVPGTSIGPYEVVSPLGAGGMGEVYLARDTRLHRDVAIKTLPPAFATDAQRLVRFEREARALAALSHPNIAAIHGLEEVPPGDPAGTPGMALVLELVQGKTLADRLSHGPIRLEEGLTIAEQIADALEAAHERGIIHRDLKPSNVKITPSGVVKVLDFGLAKIAEEAAQVESTMTVMPVTGAAMVLGTPGYMAPEQVQGGPVDKRADVWAFGVLLYEMLSGQHPFRRASVQDTLAATLTVDPDWDRVPRAVRTLLRRCLERDPRRRLRDVGDFRFLVDRDATGESPVRSTPRQKLLVWISSAVAAVALAVAAYAWFLARPTHSGGPARLMMMLPAGISVTRGPGIASSVALSPDGRTLVVAARDKDGPRLYSRALERLEAVPIAGTERASSPFFSPDGAWVGFFADGRLKRVPAAGGNAVDIVAAPGVPGGASWGPDDRIVFASGGYGRLFSVDAHGGEPEPLRGAESGNRPEVLPDGTVLFDLNGWVYALDRKTERGTRLVQGFAPRYAMGYLIVCRGSTLLAAPLDVSREPSTFALVPLQDRVAGDAGPGGGLRHYAVSPGGTLAYVRAADAYALTTVDGKDTERLLVEPQQWIENPQFSPDGQLVAVAVSRQVDEMTDLWIHELATDTTTRLTFDGGRAPVWTPDGSAITYSHFGETSGIYMKRVDGRGEASLLLPLSAFHWLVGWADERTLVYGVMEEEGSQSSIMEFSGGTPRRIVGPGLTWGGRLSPDGRWLAYYSLDSGNFEVYVVPFPQSNTRWLIAEGTDPTWGPDGKDVYYRSGVRLMAARIDTSSGMRVLTRRVVLEPFLPPMFDDYDVHSDGKTLVVARPVGEAAGREVALVVNWFAELRRLR